jgi:hypothetical protein
MYNYVERKASRCRLLWPDMETDRTLAGGGNQPPPPPQQTQL